MQDSAKSELKFFNSSVGKAWLGRDAFSKTAYEKEVNAVAALVCGPHVTYTGKTIEQYAKVLSYTEPIFKFVVCGQMLI